MKTKVAVTALLMFSLSPLTPSQTPQSPPQKQDKQSQEDVVRITTNLVQIDVVVTDKDGKQVTDLRPDEFEILEDDKRQQITNFSYVSAVTQTATVTGGQPAAAAKASTVPPARLRREQVRRTIALVVDDLGLSFESMASVRSGLRKFVDEQMQPNDLVAIIRTSAGSGGAQHFTSDKRQLHAAIDRVNWYAQGRSGLSSHRTLNEPSAGSDFRDITQIDQEMEESRANIYSVGTFNTVGAIVRGLGEMPGRKSLVLLSEAFRLFSAQGRNVQVIQAMSRLVEQANAASVSIYTVDASGLQVDALDAADQPAARAYIITPQQLAQAGVTGPSVAPNLDPEARDRADGGLAASQAKHDAADAFRRLHSMMDQRRVARNENHTVLSYLAEGTGGSFVKNRNDLGAGIGDIMSAQSGYYLIGYRPSDPSADPATGRPRRREISVKVKRPGLKARTRAGYFGVRDEEQQTRPRTRDEQLSAALLSPFSSGDVGVTLTSLFGTEPGGASPYVRSLLHVDAGTLTFKESGGARATDLDVILVAFGADGRVVEQASYPQTVRAADEQEYQRLMRDGLTYIVNLPIKSAGAYQIRAAVRDSTSERVGAAAQFVEVPDLSKQRLVLSGVVVSGVNAAAGAAAEPDPQAGPAVRRLRQGTMLDYRYNVFNAKLGADGKPQLQTQMRLFRDGQPVFTGKLLPLDASTQADLKRIAAAGRLRIGGELVPGQYTIQVTVTDALAPEGRRTATQWSDFEVVN